MPDLFDNDPTSVNTPCGDLLWHVRSYAKAVAAGIADLRLPTVAAYLDREAFTGRLRAKRPCALLFRRWVKAERPSR